jgi:hypothetical protein
MTGAELPIAERMAEVFATTDDGTLKLIGALPTIRQRKSRYLTPNQIRRREENAWRRKNGYVISRPDPNSELTADPEWDGLNNPAWGQIPKF